MMCMSNNATLRTRNPDASESSQPCIETWDVQWVLAARTPGLSFMFCRLFPNAFGRKSQSHAIIGSGSPIEQSTDGKILFLLGR